MSGILSIEVHFDLICPWCLIGNRRLAPSGANPPGVLLAAMRDCGAA